MTSCMVCIEPYTNQPHRKQAKCPYCDVDACVKCTQTYLLSTTEDPHCLGCRKGWSREVLDGILLTTWINGEYKLHRENILLDRERSRLPAAQIILERRKRVKEEREPIRAELLKQIGVLDMQISRLRNQLFQEMRIIDTLNRGEDPFAPGGFMDGTEEAKKIKEERRVFVMPCPATDCRGFLSQAYKCGVCDIYACPECREVKGKDREAEHTCNADTVATVQRLKKDCRPCPECGAQIFKIEGCFRMDTPVRLWNGGVKMSQDIVIGDELIGDDGNKRTVMTLVQGEDNLYEVKQTNGEAYIVNSKHTLVLKYSGDKSLHWNESSKFWKVQWFDRQTKTTRTKNFTVAEYSSKENALIQAENFISTLTFPEEIEITIEDYNTLDKWTKRCMMGFKSSNGVMYDSKEVVLDPYLLGLWLGDGTQSHPIIASNDIEVQQYLLEWCDKNDAELVHDEGVKFRIRRCGNTNHKNDSRSAVGFGSSSETCIGCKYKKMDICDRKLDSNSKSSSGITTNPLSDLLKKYNLLNNKHIPYEYLMNSRNIRLKVLAGLVDTDGSVPKEQQGKRVVITQSEGKLVKDIEFLAKSLGFVVNTTKTERKNMSIFGNEPKDFKDIYKINISGENLHEIPTLISRKKCVGFTPNKDYQRSGIEVSFKEYGNYYGWSVDGNKRFLHEDFTVLRNCDQMFCTACNTPFSWLSGKKVTHGAIHNPHYFEFLRKSNGGVMPRTPGDIPCGANLPGAWIFEREINRAYPGIPAEIRQSLYSALNRITHIQHVEIPASTNRAEDTDNTYINLSYLTNEISEKRWKQLLQQKEKRRLKKDELRMRYEAFVGACVDIYGQIMAMRGQPQKDVKPVVEEAHRHLLKLREIFNESMMDISRRYKCTVLQLGESGLQISKLKFKAQKKSKKGKDKADSDSDIEELSDDEAPINTIVPM